ncbi:UDP-3-O-(3-hydroxymyristoyl)glucosamine N-acyltransferase [Methylomicrobium sp. Wu6]|uniref:UDP-3-O-(3-hydroxymyristoyl)glucosamine N-acyltransferase n=1 Tax=Methylomicrobium sp. Wu6 TaxID=3107928 RepID=UPI002DD643CD|nr:UDP-3-O-(3-hydroxymyristoyl)glucosamine N-acyltransferase [Methylomicrobium sp. Wu6]MEC4750144.1 UDP-3-O-(3-hydroxymyristoyl)glucosamine N-acyltransferase [Methylomicrobium sp. Wu6]
MPITVKELAVLCGARIEGGDADQTIHSAADISSAKAGQVTQLTSAKYAVHLQQSAASACLIGEEFTTQEVPESLALLVCKDPELAFIEAVKHLHPERVYTPEIAPQAVLANDVTLGESVYIGPYAVIGEWTAIGDHSAILAGAYLGSNVKIGKHCRIHPYAVIYDDVEIGDHVTIHSGAIIGADGFGYKFRNGAHVKVPQIGNVRIEDNVEIGANTCIDRGALGSTVIGTGSKIDNLVQIGHNNKVGRHVIMCGQTGVSGSCTIDDYAILAGSSGIADHVTIGKGAVVLARSGVAGDIPPGAQYFGSPAKDKKTAYKEQLAIQKLPDLIKKIKKLEEKLLELEKKP